MDLRKIYEAYADDLADFRNAKSNRQDFIDKTNAKADNLIQHWNPESDASFDLNGIHFDVEVRYNEYDWTHCKIEIYPSTLANKDNVFDRYVKVNSEKDYITKLLSFALGVKEERHYDGNTLELDPIRCLHSKENFEKFAAIFAEFGQKYDEIMAPIHNFSKNIKRYSGINKAKDNRIKGPKGNDLEYDYHDKQMNARRSFVDEYNVKPGDEVNCSVGGYLTKVTVTKVNDDGTVSIVTSNGGRKRIPIRDLAVSNLPGELRR